MLDTPTIVCVPEVASGYVTGEPEDNYLSPRPPARPRHQSPLFLSVTLCQPPDQTIENIEDALQNALPKRNNNDDQIFRLCRALLALELNTGENLSAGDRKHVLVRWHRIGIETVQLDPEKTLEDYLTLFFTKTAIANVPLGKSLDWEVLMKELDHRPLPPANIFECKKIRRLILFCNLMQEFWGDKPFFISCRKCGPVIGVSHETANKYLNALIGAEVLELVSKGGFKNGHKVASRYRYKLPIATAP